MNNIKIKTALKQCCEAVAKNQLQKPVSSPERVGRRELEKKGMAGGVSGDKGGPGGCGWL